MLRHPIRPVTIASLSGPRADDVDVMALISQAAREKPSLIVTPEAWDRPDSEPLDSPRIQQLQALAAQHGVYIVHATRIAKGNSAVNAALLIDRAGRLMGRYEKLFPYWSELRAGSVSDVDPGQSVWVADCDFGRVGFAICFDANFPSVWAGLAEAGAELVVFTSAYAAGRQLAAHALNHHYPIVTSTRNGYCMVYDIDGERTVNSHCPGAHIEWITLDLDRCIFHENFNEDKLQALLTEKPRRVEIERRDVEPQWIIVRSARAGVSARETCKAAGMEELRAYKRRSYEAAEALRKELYG